MDYYNFDLPFILAGDVNVGIDKDNIHRYEEFKTKLEKYGLKNCVQGTEYEYETLFFIPKNSNVHEFYVDKMIDQKGWRGLSDHCPIIADFS